MDRRHSCAVCKQQRVKCEPNCKFLNNLPKEKYKTYEKIHQVFGFSQFEIFYDKVDQRNRDRMIDSYLYQANSRIERPILGVNQEIESLKFQLANTKRLAAEEILVSGLGVTLVEFCKYIMVAGVKSVTLHDDRMATPELLRINTLINPDDYRDKTISQLCKDTLMKFNSTVALHVRQGSLSNLNDAEFQEFDAVIISSCSEKRRSELNLRLRQLPKPVAFYSVECRGCLAEIFVDLNNQIKSERLFGETVDTILEFPSFERAIAVPWQELPQGMSKVYYAMRVAENFEATNGRFPGELYDGDIENIKTFKDLFCAKQHFTPDSIPDAIIAKLVGGTTCDIFSIVGAIMAQDFIHYKSGGKPIKNFFLYDGGAAEGMVTEIGC